MRRPLPLLVLATALGTAPAAARAQWDDVGFGDSGDLDHGATEQPAEDAPGPDGPALDPAPDREAAARPERALPREAEREERQEGGTDVSLTGALVFDLSLWSERLRETPFASARQTLDLGFRLRRGGLRLVVGGHAEYDPVWIDPRAGQDRGSRRVHLHRVDSGEAYVAVGKGPLDLSVGRQVVSFGDALLLPVADIVTPRDLRDPGLAEVAPALPVAMTRLALFRGEHQLEVLAVHEPRFDLVPAPFGEHAPTRALLLGAPSVIEAGVAPTWAAKRVTFRHRPGRAGLRTQQVYARWLWRGAGGDLGLYAASSLSRPGVLELPEPSAWEEDHVALGLRHPRVTTIGHTAVVPRGDFTVRWEVALDLGRPVQVGDPLAFPPQVGWERRNLLTGMVGVTYAGVPDATFTVELQDGTHTDSPRGPGPQDPPVLVPVGLRTVAGRWSHRLLRDRLRLEGVLAFHGPEMRRHAMARASAEVELGDGFTFTLGYLHLRPGPGLGPMAGQTRHDRLFAQLRWDWAA